MVPPPDRLHAAIAAHAAGRTTEAESMLTGLLRAQPHHPDALHLLGLWSWKRGEQGLALVEQACALAPDRAGYHSTRGVILAGKGDLDSAVAAFEQALRCDPAHVESISNLAAAQMRAGRPGRAERLLAGARAQRPRDPALIGRHGEALLALEHFTDAVHALGTAARMRPGEVRWQRGHARALSRMWKVPESQAAWAELSAQHPDDLEAIAGVALAQHRGGHSEDALQTLSPHLTAGAQSPPLLVALAQVAAQLRRPELAIPPITALLESDPRDADVLWHHLGRLRDAAGDHDGAFTAWTRSHALRDLPAHADLERASADAIIDLWSPDHIAAMPRARGGAAPRPVFIVGFPRSGTSLTEQILASHPDVHGAGELRALHRIATGLPRRSGTDWTDGARDVDRKSLKRLARSHRAALAQEAQGAALVTDKMPQNYRYIGLIGQVFPDAAVIWCQRDPLDTCVSNYGQFLSPLNPGSAPLAELGHCWNQMNRLMTHWSAAPPVPILPVRYADLVNDLPTQARHILAFLGLPWRPAVLDFHTSTRQVRTASYAQVRQPVHNSSVGRARRYAGHLAPLRAALESGE